MRNTMDLVKAGIVIATMIFLATVGVAIGGCNPLPGHPVTPDEAPATYQTEPCPCPDFAVTDHPEDPGEAPGTYCLAKSRTNQWMDARNHPRCRQEALERMGW